MKLRTIASAGLFAAIAALSMGAQAAADTDKTTEAKTPVAGIQADKTVKLHSHMEEKTGMPQQKSSAAAAEGKPGKAKADKDKSKHYHPRDGKS